MRITGVLRFIPQENNDAEEPIVDSSKEENAVDANDTQDIANGIASDDVWYLPRKTTTPRNQLSPSYKR